MSVIAVLAPTSSLELARKFAQRVFQDAQHACGNLGMVVVAELEGAGFGEVECAAELFPRDAAVVRRGLRLGGNAKRDVEAVTRAVDWDETGPRGRGKDGVRGGSVRLCGRGWGRRRDVLLWWCGGDVAVILEGALCDFLCWMSVCISTA